MSRPATRHRPLSLRCITASFHLHRGQSGERWEGPWWPWSPVRSPIGPAAAVRSCTWTGGWQPLLAGRPRKSLIFLLLAAVLGPSLAGAALEDAPPRQKSVVTNAASIPAGMTLYAAKEDDGFGGSQKRVW